MLPKQYRLARSDFDLVFKKGRRIRGKTFSLVVLPSENKDETSKIGIVITKKVHKKAVDRNKLKRQVSDIVYHYALGTLPKGLKAVIMAFPTQKSREYQETKEEIIDLFDKATC